MNAIIKAFLTPRMLAVFMLGISSGLPLLLIGSTLKAWLKESNVDLTVIGLFASIQLPYTLKFLWSPLFDAYKPPFLDQRRGWIVITQLALALALAALAFVDPVQSTFQVAQVALVIAFFSASQDIAIDAYRRAILKEEELGLGSSLAVNGYRIGMLLAGAGALTLADQVSWQTTYLAMAGCMAVFVIVPFLAPPIEDQRRTTLSIRDAVIEPFKDYFRRSGAWEILLFILLFKLGDQMASDMLTPFYLDIGFTKTEIGVVSKFYGLWATIIGGILGGVLLLRMEMTRALWIFGILQALSTLGFALLAMQGNSIPGLAAVVTFENITSGLGTAAYVAFMAGLCNRTFTATQYTLLSSLMGVPRAVFGSATGWMAQSFGWVMFFVICAVIALPGLMMLARAKHWQMRS